MIKNLLLHYIQISIIFCLSGLTNLTAQPPTIICPGGSITLDDLGTNDPQFWNAAYWTDPVTNTHDLAENGTLLEFSGTDHCSFYENLNFKYILSLDLDHNNTFETFIDSDSLPAKNTVYSGNQTGNLFSGIAREFDSRPVNLNQKWGFGIVVIPVGNGRKARVVWKNELGQIADPQIPYGTHKIKWVVTDSCGVSSVCEYGFTVKDSKKPTVVCLNGLSVNLMNIFGGMVQLWASDFLQYTDDNYTPSSQLKIAIRRTGSGIGYPYNFDGTPQTGVQFTCADIGTRLVELWTKDQYGNTDKCETYVLIQDNMYACGVPIQHDGTITTETGAGISDVLIELSSTSSGVPVFSTPAETDTSGHFRLNYSLPFGPNTLIAPVHEQDPLNGVNTWDLIIISRHILGLDPLPSPYKLISADVNQSGTITTFDIVELRKLILGTYTELPGNHSWRFVDKFQTFTNPANPFADTLRESVPFGNINAPLPLDFIGCKIGDVDLTAVPHFKGDAEERNFEQAYILLKDKQLHAGESTIVHFSTPEYLQGLQMTVSTKDLNVEKIIPGSTVSNDNFGLFGHGDSDRFVPGFTAVFENGMAAFDVKFTALNDGWLSEMLQISNDITPAMAFENNGRRRDVALRFEQENETANQPVLFQNSPNPWSNSTSIGFYLPEAGEAELTVTNQNGVVVYTSGNYYTIGNHEVILNRQHLPADGMYYVRLMSGGFTAVKKMVVAGR